MGPISIEEYYKLRIVYLPHCKFVDSVINYSEGKILI
jgi:hypothetical protein